MLLSILQERRNKERITLPTTTEEVAQSLLNWEEIF
jgi:hypothetical protein